MQAVPSLATGSSWGLPPSKPASCQLSPTASNPSTEQRQESTDFYLQKAKRSTHLVNQLLRLLLGDAPRRQVSLNVAIQEGIHPAQAHRSAVLLLDSAQVRVVQELYRLAGAAGGPRDVVACTGGAG